MSFQTLNRLYSDQPTVGAVFRNTKYAEGHEKAYTYLVPDELDPKVGELGMVEKDGVYSIVTIVRVDEVSKVDPTASYQYKWIVGLIDPSTYNERLTNERKVMAQALQDAVDRI